MNMVVYSRNDTNTPTDRVDAVPSTLPKSRGTANAHTATVVPCTASMSVGQNVVHAWWMRLNSLVTSTLWSLNRRFSRSSWLKALTTRIPGIVSDSTSVTRDHFLQARKKSRLSRSPCTKMAQQKAGTGTVMTNPSFQSRLISTAPRPTSMTNDSDTSTMPNARNSHSRSVSELTRVIKLPVFLRE